MEETCISAERLSESVGFRLLLFVKAVFCLIGIIATGFSLKINGTKWLVHVNTKTLYVIHIFWTLEVASSYLIVFLFEFIRLSLHQTDPCAYTIPATLGITLRVIPVAGVVIQSFTMCAFAIERTISTIWPSAYEGVKKPHLGLFLGICSMLFGMGSVYYSLIKPVEWNDIQITSTVKTNSNKDSYQTLMYMYMSVELITITLFLISFIVNRKYCKSNGKESLSWKYQVKENRKVILSLLPCFMTHCILNVLMICGLYSYNLLYPVFDKINSAFWIEAVSHVQLYALLMPAIIAIRLRVKKVNIINSHSDSNAYFQQMANDWNRVHIDLWK